MVTGISSSARHKKETDDFCRTRSRSCCLLCPPYCVSWEWHLLLQVYLCSLYREVPQPLDMGHGSSTFLLVAGSTRRQKRCSSSSVFPKYNPEIFSRCFWLKKLQKLDLHHHQTTAPRGADNSLSNVVSIDLKMRFASAILCGIWSPLMSRNWSEWNLSSTAQLLTPEQVVGTGSFILPCWNTGWYHWWMKDVLRVLTLPADHHTDNSWLPWYFIRSKLGIVSSRNLYFSHYGCFYSSNAQHSIKYWWEMR